MKNLLLVLVLALTVFSCTPEPKAEVEVLSMCGMVTSFEIKNSGSMNDTGSELYVVYLDYNQHFVTLEVFQEVQNSNPSLRICI
mgnify:CR=1 FL=1